MAQPNFAAATNDSPIVNDLAQGSRPAIAPAPPPVGHVTNARCLRGKGPPTGVAVDANADAAIHEHLQLVGSEMGDQSINGRFSSTYRIQRGEIWTVPAFWSYSTSRRLCAFFRTSLRKALGLAASIQLRKSSSRAGCCNEYREKEHLVELREIRREHTATRNCLPDHRSRSVDQQIHGTSGLVGLDIMEQPYQLSHNPMRTRTRPSDRTSNTKSLRRVAATPKSPASVRTTTPKRTTFNRAENIRQIPPGDPDYERLKGRRSDAEAANRQIDDDLYLRRAHSVGTYRQLLDLIGFAFAQNSLARHRHPAPKPLAAAA